MKNELKRLTKKDPRPAEFKDGYNGAINEANQRIHALNDKITALQLQLEENQKQMSAYGLCLSAALRGEKRSDEPPCNGRLDAVRELVDRNESFMNTIARLDADLRAARENAPPIENGTNRYGLDMSYFRGVINRELMMALDNHKPDELARVFARLSVTADSSVIREPEFNKNTTGDSND
jgi:hypothetical protein